MPRANPEDKKAYDRAYYAARQSQLAAKQRAYYRQNRESCMVRNAEWFRKNPFKYAAIKFANHANERAAKFGCSGHLLGQEVIRLDGPCTYCGGPSDSWDHVIPLCQHGPNIIANITPCCLTCNKQKADRTPWEWKPDCFRPSDWQKVMDVLT